MIEIVAYLVRWTRGNAAGESRRFGDWGAAKEFFEEVAADRETTAASLLEITEREVRGFEREPAGAGAESRRQVGATK